MECFHGLVLINRENLHQCKTYILNAKFVVEVTSTCITRFLVRTQVGHSHLNLLIHKSIFVLRVKFSKLTIRTNDIVIHVLLYILRSQCNFNVSICTTIGTRFIKDQILICHSGQVFQISTMFSFLTTGVCSINTGIAVQRKLLSLNSFHVV